MTDASGTIDKFTVSERMQDMHANNTYKVGVIRKHEPNAVTVQRHKSAKMEAPRRLYFVRLCIASVFLTTRHKVTSQ